MVLSYFGRYTRVADLRRTLDPGRDGLSARDLKIVAESEGLRVRAFRLEYSALPNVPKPTIIHWGLNHYVVIERVTDKYIAVADPARGRSKLGHDEALKAFTGIALTFEKTNSFRSRPKPSLRKSAWGSYLRIVGGLPGLRSALIVVLVATVAVHALGLVLPLMTKIVVDEVVPSANLSAVHIVGAAAVLMAVANILMSYARGVTILRCRARLDEVLLTHFMKHMLDLPYDYFHRRTSGDLMMRLSGNLVLREFFTSQGIAIIFDVGMVLIYLMILAFWNLAFSVVTLSIALVQVVIFMSTLSRVHTLTQHELEAATEERSYVIQILRAIGIVKASGFQGEVLARWRGAFTKALNISVQRDFIQVGLSAVAGFRAVLGPVVLLWFGAWLVLDGQLPLGTMLALTSMAGMVFLPIGALVQSAAQAQHAEAHLERVIDVLNEPPERTSPDTEAMPAVPQRLVCDKIWFRYVENAPWVLQDVSLSIDPGEFLGVCGPTGSGKSTLAMLLCGLYQPSKGHIVVGDIDRNRIDLTEYRRNFGIVMQDPVLFGGSLRQNILFGRETLGMERLTEAARLAEIHDDIMQFPMTYETLVGEGGQSLSGGQRQRVALAAALVGRPQLLILDEATSSLDPTTEARIHANLRGLRCTRIVISHRYSTLQDADRIIYVKNGVVVDEGSATEMLRKLKNSGRESQ